MKAATVLLGCPGCQRVDDGFADDSLIRLVKTVPTLDHRAMESGPDGPVTIGLDVGKREIFSVLRWSDGTFERPWKVHNPSELTLLVQLLQDIAKKRSLIVAMESTGTYGDALRQA